jgi:hypothetical protein
MQAFLPHRDETNETLGFAQKERARTPARFAMDPGLEGMERNTGFEPATFALARRRSTS